jgi:hypothetical protein
MKSREVLRASDLNKAYLKISPLWDSSFDATLNTMPGVELENLSYQVWLAERGGGLLRNDYSYESTLQRVLPGGEITPREHGGLGYSKTTYYSSFAKSDGQLHVLHGFGANSFVAEAVSNQLLVFSIVGEKRVVAHYNKDDDKTLKLSLVGIDYGYTSGAVKSAPSGFMPITRRATFLDALIIDAAGKTEYQYNSGSRIEFDNNTQEWFDITTGQAICKVKVSSEVDDEKLIVKITDGLSISSEQGTRQSESPAFSVPLQYSLSVDLSSVLLTDKREQDEAYVRQLDALAESFTHARPVIAV